MGISMLAQSPACTYALPLIDKEFNSDRRGVQMFLCIVKYRNSLEVWTCNSMQLRGVRAHAHTHTHTCTLTAA